MKHHLAACVATLLLAVPATAADLFEHVDHHVVSNNGVMSRLSSSG